MRSSTCVVAMFTTAGSTRFTIDANEFDAGIGSGTAKAVAEVPANPRLFIAETRPETTDPIRIPTAKVKATNTPASILRRLAQLISSLTCSPMFAAPLVQAPTAIFVQVERQMADPTPAGPQPLKYNTANSAGLLVEIDWANR